MHRLPSIVCLKLNVKLTHNDHLSKERLRATLRLHEFDKSILKQKSSSLIHQLDSLTTT